MSVQSAYEHAKTFCSSLLENSSNLKSEVETLVTLTYAQSLDGKISGNYGQQLTLSCEESMIMTHRLRALHDGILVGVGTLLNDNPRLTARLLGPDEPESTIQQPQPIILDSKLRFPLSAKVLSQSKKSPWIFTSHDHDPNKRELLEKAGAKIISIDSDQNGLLSINHLLSTLRSPPFSINRLMVEGGAKIIDSFLKSGKVDLLIITIAPILVGANGVSAISNNNLVENNSEDKLPKLTNVTYEKFGRDIVLIANILNN
ncbi:dihydrofolate reductase-like domain-containing protein [Gigaspora rosea]|uniref:2,5-diamino-6-ribosylamino-4(3H)-pyrimidinone 5'-phosphate reductase n=1 Tax=Gigaspora rosea TaxID=44941 RepID=A0A397VT51_9GLOM|nr:dihydrofolate reductase-like domain-containing protein [Gigaspora rosea]